MPSLIEGFGQVFLEALSYGCPILGTFNTCLPDLGGEEDGIFLTEVGNLDQLTYQLEYLAEKLPTNPKLRQKALSCAERFSWQNFRDKLCSVLSLSQAVESHH
jgi:glycosyltransferase involved in cell wall biosynthesis